MKPELMYELEKEYDHFKLWNVFAKRFYKKEFLYKTTTHKAEESSNYQKYFKSQKKMERNIENEFRKY